jgi:hypothetical protein
MKNRKCMRINDLAIEAFIDLDEALVRLWDGGLNDITGPDSVACN